MNKVWTEDEEKELVYKYPYLSNKQISLFLNKTISSIQHKAVKLSLRKDRTANFIIRSESRMGDKCPSWKGGRKINNKGRILVLRKGNPMSDKNGYVLEHRLIMSEYMGRPLKRDEVVHHINEIKTDNRIENLQLMTHGEHTKYHNLKRSKKYEQSNTYAEG